MLDYKGKNIITDFVKKKKIETLQMHSDEGPAAFNYNRVFLLL